MSTRLPLWGLMTLPVALAGQAGGDRCADAPATAQPFAEVLADSGRLFRASISRDGGTLYYFKKVTPGREDYRIFVSRLRDGAWTAGERLDLGGDYSDLYPSLSADGRRLVFASYRPAPGDTARVPNAYLWYADRQGDRWGPPHFIAAAAEFGSYHSGPVIGADYGISAHRTSPDWRTITDVAFRWDGSRYLPQAVAAGPGARWRAWRPGVLHVWHGQPTPAGDFGLVELSVIDSTTRRPGRPDVWVTRWRDGDWSEPVPAGGGINTPGGENFLVQHPNGCELVFTRDFTRFYRVSLAAVLAPALSR